MSSTTPVFESFSAKSYRILIVEVDTSGNWRCTNDNVDYFSPTCLEFFSASLVEFLSDYLARPSFECW
jgi:hypothetical protein